MCCQTCSCHGSHGVLHHSDLTWQSEESEDSPAEQAVNHATAAWHAVLHQPPGEHAVHDAASAGRAGAFLHKASDAAGPAEALGLVQHQGLLHLIGK